LLYFSQNSACSKSDTDKAANSEDYIFTNAIVSEWLHVNSFNLAASLH